MTMKLDFLPGFQRLGVADSPEIIHECRHCGTNVPSDGVICPICEHEGIATYEIR